MGTDMLVERKTVVEEILSLQKDLLQGKVMCEIDESEVDSLFTAFCRGKKEVISDALLKLLKVSNKLVSHANVPMREEMVDMLSTMQETMLQQMDQKLDAFKTSLTNQILGKEDQKPKIQQILIQNKDTTPITETENIKAQLQSVKVKNTSVTNNGNVVLQFPDETSKKAAETIIKQQGTVTTTDISREEATVLPKIRIENVNEDVFVGEDRDAREKTFLELIREKNPELQSLIEEEEEFKIVFMSARDKHVVVKVSPKIRKCLRDLGDRLFQNMSSMRLFDHFQLTQCFHCQGFGHKSGSPRCPAKDEKQTCLYCAKSGHRSKECRSKSQRSKHCCINCSRSSDADIRNNASTHNSTSEMCPIVIRETKILIDKTIGAQVSKNAYLARLRNLHQRIRR